MGGIFIPSGGGGGTVSGTFPTAAAIAKAVEIEAGNNFQIGTSSIDGRTLILRSQADNDATSLFEVDGVTAVTDGSVFTVAGGGGSVDTEVGVSSVDGRVILLRNKSDGTTKLVETDGTTAVTDGSTFLLPSSKIIPRDIVPVSKEYPIGAAAHAVTTADILALATYNPATENVAIAEIHIEPDQTNPNDLNIAFTNGSTFIIQRGVISKSFGSDSLQPANMDVFTINAPIGNGFVATALIIKALK